MLHEVAEPLLYLVVVALVGGAVTVWRRGPVPAGRYFASTLVVSAIALLDRLRPLGLPKWVEVTLSGILFTSIALFVGHTPRRRAWLPASRRGEATVALAIFGAAFMVHWFGHFDAPVIVEPSWRWAYLPMFLLVAIVPGAVAALFMLDAVRLGARPDSRRLVWLALAFSVQAALFAYRLRLDFANLANRARLVERGLDVPGWVYDLDRVLMASHAAGLAMILVAFLLAVGGLVARRGPTRALVVYVVSVPCSGLAGSLGSIWVDRLDVPSAAMTVGLVLDAAPELALALLGTWAVVGLRPSGRSTPGSAEIDLPTDPANDVGEAPGPGAPGDPARFHPRLGLEDPER